MEYPRFPEIKVDIDLSGEDGSQFVVLARVMNALARNKVDIRLIQKFRADIASCKDYNAVLATIAMWVNFNGGIFLENRKWIR